MRILVVDDEPLARSGVQARLARHPDVQVVGECETGQAAVMAIRDLVPDVVFLDIRMPDLDGFEVLRQLSPGKLPFVIFSQPMIGMPWMLSQFTLSTIC